MTSYTVAHGAWVADAYRKISRYQRADRVRDLNAPTARNLIYRQLAGNPEAAIAELVDACAHAGVKVDPFTAYAYRSRFRATLRVLAEAGVDVPS